MNSSFYDPENEKIYDPDEPALDYKNISTEELKMLRKKFVLYVKLPKEFWPYIERSEKLDDIGKSLEEHLHLIYNETVFDNDGCYDDKGNLHQHLNKLEETLNK